MSPLSSLAPVKAGIPPSFQWPVKFCFFNILTTYLLSIVTGNVSQVGMGGAASDLTTAWNILASGPTPAVAAFDSADIVDDGQSFYVAYVMTDGDNVQWILHDYTTSDHWYANPQRGEIPPACAGGSAR